jgi:hypothetical protein
MDPGTSRSRCAASFFRLPPGLAHAGCASNARCDASQGAPDCFGKRTSLRLHGQCARRGWTKHLLSSLRRALDRSGLLRNHVMGNDARRRMREMREGLCGRLRGASRRLGIAALAGSHSNALNTRRVELSSHAAWNGARLGSCGLTRPRILRTAVAFSCGTKICARGLLGVNSESETSTYLPSCRESALPGKTQRMSIAQSFPAAPPG